MNLSPGTLRRILNLASRGSWQGSSYNGSTKLENMEEILTLRLNTLLRMIGIEAICPAMIGEETYVNEFALSDSHV